MKNRPELNRRIEILSKILNNEFYSKTYYADVFRTSEVTISRDLNFFRSMGIPVYSRNKKIILDKICSDQPIESIFEDYISLSALKELIKTPKSLDKINYLKNIAYCHLAIDKKQHLQMDYQEIYYGEIKKYFIVPIRISLIGFNWCINAVDQNTGEECLFYISQIQRIKSVSKRAIKFSKINKHERAYKMNFRFTKKVASQIKAKIWFEKYELITLGDGRVDLFAVLPITDKLAGWCVSWWDQIEIISPPELKEYIKAMCHYFSVSNMILSRS